MYISAGGRCIRLLTAHCVTSNLHTCSYTFLEYCFHLYFQIHKINCYPFLNDTCCIGICDYILSYFISQLLSSTGTVMQ